MGHCSQQPLEVGGHPRGSCKGKGLLPLGLCSSPQPGKGWNSSSFLSRRVCGNLLSRPQDTDTAMSAHVPRALELCSELRPRADRSVWGGILCP